MNSQLIGMATAADPWRRCVNESLYRQVYDKIPLAMFSLRKPCTALGGVCFCKKPNKFNKFWNLFTNFLMTINSCKLFKSFSKALCHLVESMILILLIMLRRLLTDRKMS